MRIALGKLGARWFAVFEDGPNSSIYAEPSKEEALGALILDRGPALGIEVDSDGAQATPTPLRRIVLTEVSGGWRATTKDSHTPHWQAGPTKTYAVGRLALKYPRIFKQLFSVLLERQ
jgi:hypothetical protein